MRRATPAMAVRRNRAARRRGGHGREVSTDRGNRDRPDVNMSIYEFCPNACSGSFLHRSRADSRFWKLPVDTTYSRRVVSSLNIIVRAVWAPPRSALNPNLLRALLLVSVIRPIRFPLFRLRRFRSCRTFDFIRDEVLLVGVRAANARECGGDLSYPSRWYPRMFRAILGRPWEYD